MSRYRAGKPVYWQAAYVASDWQQVRKQVMSNQSVAPKDLRLANQIADRAAVGHRPRMVAAIVCALLLLACVIFSLVSSQWIWIPVPGILLTMTAQVLSLRQERQARRWKAHHKETAGK